MPFQVKILADSVTHTEARLTTFELTYPRFIHSEFMTHRMFSRNAASSRAIPVEKMIQRVLDDPAMPVYWGKNQKGMQAHEELAGASQAEAERLWLEARDLAVEKVRQMQEIDLHKQIANRLLEPWMWITVICSATEYANFFHLRCHPDAQPEFQKLARMMYAEYSTSTPRELSGGEWHLPLIQGDEWDRIGNGKEISIADACKISIGRCARVSYLTHDGQRDIQADIDLCDRLSAAGHWSPFEHVATPCRGQANGNFIGWVQFRKNYQRENVRFFEGVN